MKMFPGLVVFFLMISICPLGLATFWYVGPPSLGSDSNPGTEGQPFATIQKGIDTAGDADTVFVSEGIYTENVDFGGKNLVLRSRHPADPAVVETTIIDGNAAAPTVTFAGTEDETCVLYGFTIRNGLGSTGGGIRGGTAEQHTQATIQNNIIAGNTSTNGGGVAYCDGLINNSWIYGNSSTGNGGGLSECNGVIQNNLIAGSASIDLGGGLYSCGGTIRNNTIVDNAAGASGGGMRSCPGPTYNYIL